MNVSTTQRFALSLAIALFARVATGGETAAAPATSSLSDQTLVQIRFDQKLNAQITPALAFTDENGRRVALGDFFGRRPLILILGYYRCPMLCSLVLNAAIESLQDLKPEFASQFELIDVSIDPAEGPDLAAAKKQTCLKRYGRESAANSWHFLTGDEASIRRLADEAGFRFAYDSASKQFAHPSGLIILTPDGKVSRYFFGVSYPPEELSAALREAGAGKAGSPIEQLFMLCFHYNPLTGPYGKIIMLSVRIAGATTVLVLLALVLKLSRRRSPAKGASQ